MPDKNKIKTIAEQTYVILELSSGKSVKVKSNNINLSVDSLEHAINHRIPIKIKSAEEIVFINTNCVERIRVSGAGVAARAFKKQA